MTDTYPNVETLASLFLLEDVKGFGPQKFKAIHRHAVTPDTVIADPERLPVDGKTGETLRKRIRAIRPEQLDDARRQAEVQIERNRQHGGHILTYDHPAYPPTVYRSNNPVPVLFTRGPLDPLANRRAIACVGSRKITRTYEVALEQFALAVYRSGGVVVSGFALGADSVGHRAVFDAEHAHTICVMPSGLDRPFPPENRDLWQRLLDSDRGVFVTEFRYGRMADKLTLRKRNKLIVAFAEAVLVAQSAPTGGAMNAYRFAIEQKKPLATFAPDGTEATGGNEIIAEHALAQSGVLPVQTDGEEYAQWINAVS